MKETLQTAGRAHDVLFPKPPPDAIRQLIASIQRRLLLIDASVETVAHALLDARLGVEGETAEEQWEHTVYYAGRFLQALNDRLGIEVAADPVAGPHVHNPDECDECQEMVMEALRE